ncbi:hypothetical protein [Burkholderia multivorans]|uniref:hypothetical protein n=1 Tax=Burkholderia multivorans TaxID=87883 RepID=UPI001C271179|nr:hypothetical protein [Burkholderia multivorans]MBU9552985.1 hypothetical protein [Burkholderia multivorans]
MAYDPNLAYNMRVQQAQQAADDAYRKQLLQLQQSNDYQGMADLLKQGGNAVPDYIQQRIQPQQPQQGFGGLLGLLQGNKQIGQQDMPQQGIPGGSLLGLLSPGTAAGQMFGNFHAAPVNVPHIQTAVQPTGSLIGTFNDPSQNLQGFNNPAMNLQGFNNPSLNYQGANDPSKNMTGGTAVARPQQSIQTGIAMGK